MGIEIGLENTPRFTESVMPYIQRNFDKVAEAFRRVSQSQIYMAGATGAETGIPAAPLQVAGTLIPFEINQPIGQFHATASVDLLNYGSGYGFVIANLQISSILYGNAVVFGDGASAGRATYSQVWAGSLPAGSYVALLVIQKGVNAGDVRYYGPHTTLMMGVFT